MHRITLELFWYELVFDPVRFLSSATIHHLRFPLHCQGLLPVTSSELLRHHPLFRYLLKKKLSTDLEDAFVRCNLFWDAMIDGYPWAPAILQKPIRSYWLIWKDSLIDFHVVLKAAELLFFRLKILFNWKIIVVEVTETFLSSGN